MAATQTLPNGNGALHVERVLITPELAQEWLERPVPQQRRIMPAHSRKLADDMRAGRWNSNNAQPVQLANDEGWVMDGRHRLTAIIESRRPQSMIVHYDCDPSTFDVIDAVAPRTPAHVFEAEGIKNSTNLEAVARLIHSWVRSAAEFSTQPPRGRVLDIGRQYHVELEPLFVVGEKAAKQTIVKVAGGRNKNPMPRSVATFLAFLEGSPDGMIGRLADYQEEAMYNHSGDAVALFRKTLQTRATSGRDTSKRAVISLFIMAKNLEHTHAAIPDKLIYRSSAEFPLPEWPAPLRFGGEFVADGGENE